MDPLCSSWFYPRKYLHSWIANDVVDVLRAFAADESAQGYFETIN